MDLVVFDLDGTLLNDASQISSFTKETLALLKDKDIAYTVATGRTMLSASKIVAGHNFDLPHVYNNGVTLWDPKIQELKLENVLANSEIDEIIASAASYGITPFVNAIGPDAGQKHQHLIYHPPTVHQVESDLVNKYFKRTDAKLLPLEALTSDSQVTNISMIGEAKRIEQMYSELSAHDALVAYSGIALEGKQFRWMDVHHRRANKGSAVMGLKDKLGAKNLICFGDGENDLSMFALADESYAPDNARDTVKQSANAIIGHNHSDGIAHFLRERFSL
jgi:Cof subfamily protein (haloacid dehalogenase superfamily)